MTVPLRLASVAEVFVACRWWKPVRIPDRRGWVNRYGLCECMSPCWCEHNTAESRLGGCVIGGNVAKLKVEKRQSDSSLRES